MTTPKPPRAKLPPSIVTQQPPKHSGLGAYYPVTPGAQPSPLTAIFLAQFDVHTGYELKWSKTIGDVCLKGVEYKALPSGLHEVARDVISFVQPQGGTDDDLLYGVSVFHQNLADSWSGDRSSVKMFSLGILVDTSKYRTSLSWKPSSYSCGLEYIQDLDKLLTEWDEVDGFEDFERFFEEHSSIDVLRSPKPPRTPKMGTPKRHQVQNQSRHHYLLKLDQLLNSLGPLVFRVWRSCLLRQRVLLFDADSIELSCAYAYCLSIISTIPHEIMTLLPDDTRPLHYLQPLYSVGVNDIDWLSKTTLPGFIGSSTDEILMFKSKLYDVAVQLKASPGPQALLSSASVPGVTNIPPLRATQRDLRRFKILDREFDLTNEEQECKPSWWVDVTEPVSWSELAWSGVYWWASAGEKEKMEDEQDTEGLTDRADINKDEVERALYIVGYFQSITRRTFRTLLDLIGNDEGDEAIKIEFSDMVEMGLDPYSIKDAEFVVDLVRCWWNRNVKFRGTLSDLCCL